VTSLLPIAFVALGLFWLFRWSSQRRIGRVLGFVAGTLLRIRRGEVEERLRHAGVPDPEIVARESYAALGASLAELLWTAGGGDPRGKIVITERAASAIHRAREEGGVVATAHLGNWDVLACAMASELPLSVITKRLSIRWLDRTWQALRARRGVRLLDSVAATRPALDALADGGTVAVLIDQAPVGKGRKLRHPFLGRMALCDTVAATLSARSGRPLFFAVSTRRADGLHQLDVPLVIEPPRRHRSAFIDRATRTLSDALAREVLRAPAQWLWLHRRWKHAGEVATAPTAVASPART
jgi:Kdo2-lipid IVA lauroyltransferase/acyltransferase